MKKLGIYVRYSMDCGMAERIVEELKNYLDTKFDWKLVDVYVDIGYAAKDTNRPELRRMFSDCMSGKLDIVLIKSSFALFRETDNLLELIKKLQSINVEIFEYESQLFLHQVFDRNDKVFIDKRKPDAIDNFLDYMFKLNHGLVEADRAEGDGFLLLLGEKSVTIPLDGDSYNVFVRALKELQ